VLDPVFLSNICSSTTTFKAVVFRQMLDVSVSFSYALPGLIENDSLSLTGYLTLDRHPPRQTPGHNCWRTDIVRLT